MILTSLLPMIRLHQMRLQANWPHCTA